MTDQVETGDSSCRCGNPAMEIIKRPMPESNFAVYYCGTCGRLKYLDHGTGIAGGLFNAGNPSKINVTWREPALLRKLASLEEAAKAPKEQPKPAEPPKEAKPPAQSEARKFKTDTVQLLSRLKKGEFVQGEPQEPNQEGDDGKNPETE